MLDADADPDALLSGVALDALGPVETEALFEGRFERIGPWKVTGHLGAGGMGTVYRGERDDGQFEQTVALKLVKRGMDTDAVLARFRAERRILGRLDHPGIARILDAGPTSDGRPCLIMEYVAGEPITAYCDARRLGVDARLRLVEQAAEAVAYAHQNLVVHRDLKPSNLLVADGPDGPRVKLLDFGIAKLLTTDDDETLTADRVFTPAYAAPEQLRGGPITTATDVYGLGAVLYRVLADERPIPTEGRSPAEIELAVLAGDVARPSTVVTPGTARARGTTPERLRRELAGDLDRIVLKALAPNAADRYASAAALVADLRRYRAGLPVEARPASRAYRARRFVARHRVALGVTAGVVALVTLITAVAFARVSAERQRVATEAAKAEAVSEFLAGLFASTDPRQTGGAEVTARELLDRGAARIRAELGDQPLVQAQMLHVTGEAYKSLQLMDAAEPLLSQALAQRQRVLGRDHPDVAASHDALGLLYELQGRYPEARDRHRAALAIYREHADTHPLELANALHGLAFAQMRLMELDAAETHIREALAIKRGLYGEAHPEIAYSLNILGDTHTFQERYDEAIAVHRRALDQRRELLGERHLDTGSSLHNLGAALREQGDFAGAETVYRDALGLYLHHFGDANQETANTLSQLSYVVLAQGRGEEAEAMYRRALAMMERGGEGDHPRVSMFHALHARGLARSGRYPDAEALMRRANAERARTMGTASPVWAARLAGYVAAQGRDAAALQRAAERLCGDAPPACQEAVVRARSEVDAEARPTSISTDLAVPS